MSEAFVRFEMLTGKKSVLLLSRKKVLVFGVGGVGGYVCEALARSGVGQIDVVDNDKVNLSNINRQIIALNSTVGRYKTDVVKERLTDINPHITCNTYNIFYLPENASAIDFSQYDYVVDAIDTVSGKIEIIKGCKEKNVPVVSSMGTGNKLDPTKILITDIYKTKGCPLARVMRGLCKKNNIDSLDVVYSTEEPKKVMCTENDGNTKSEGKSTVASSAFVPSVAGLTIAYHVVKRLLDLC